MGQYTQTQCPYCVTGAPWVAAQKVWLDRKERQDKGIDTYTHTRTHTQACWHGYARISVSLFPNECGQALGGFPPDPRRLAAGRRKACNRAICPHTRCPEMTNPPGHRSWRPHSINDASRHRNSTAVERFNRPACTSRYCRWNLRTVNI